MKEKTEGYSVGITPGGDTAGSSAGGPIFTPVIGGLGNADWEATHDPCWSELEGDAKVERMRGVVKGLRDRIDELEGRLDALVQHQHGAGGQLLTPFEEYGYPPQGRDQDGDQAWF